MMFLWFEDPEDTKDDRPEDPEDAKDDTGDDVPSPTSGAHGAKDLS